MSSGYQLLTNLKGDIAGGAQSALLYLPLSIAWGIVAFAPLGEEFTGAGILSGVYSSIIVGLVAAISGGMPLMQSGARAASALIFSTFLATLIRSDHLSHGHPELVSTLLAVAFLTVLLSGLVQMVFGWFKIGHLIKFIPYPVIVGFVNATALLVVVSQFWVLVGIPKSTLFFELSGQIANIKIGALLLGMATALLIIFFPTRLKKMPAPLVGLIIGTAVYHGLSAFGFSEHMGPTLQSLPADVPLPRMLPAFLSSETLHVLSTMWPLVALTAFSMALMGALDSLLTAAALESRSHERTDGNRVLKGLGLANVIAAGFGAIPGSGSPTRSIASISAGGSTRLAGVISSLLMLIILVFFSQLVVYIPQVVMAGLVIAVGVQIFDRWTLDRIREFRWSLVRKRPELSRNLLVISIVVSVAMLFNLIAAVFAGLVLAVLLFIVRMSRSAIKRVYFGDVVHSMTFRNPRDRQYLQTHGSLIAVLVLDGVIFFGSAEAVRREVRSLLEKGARYIIVDMEHVNDVDTTGIWVLQGLYKELIDAGKFLAISHVNKQRLGSNISVAPSQAASLWLNFRDVGALRVIDESAFFADTDRALDFCESLLVEEISGEYFKQFDVFSDQTDLFKGMSVDQIHSVRAVLKQLYFDIGTTIFKQGEAGSSLFLISSGLVDVTIDMQHMETKRRVGSLSRGTIFGETALLDGKPRSANVVAVEPVTCFCLSVEVFDTLKIEQPTIAFLLLSNISLLFAHRLRMANKMISEN